LAETPETIAIIERLNRLHPRVIDLSLGRIERLLAKLGNPEQKLAPVIHVAGTNGKGSTVAFMRAIAEAAGKRVHVYTSPHLVRFNERIRVVGEIITDAHLMRLIDECEKVNAGDEITFFEITTAVAFMAFAETPADLVLLETGLGGRLDATNVIAKPAACAITPISIDHVAFLGDTLTKIAGEKAGILKAGVPCIVSRQPDEAMDVIQACAKEIGAPLPRWSSERAGDKLRVTTPMRALSLPVPNLAGAHQIGNAGQAIATLDAAGQTFDAKALARGVTSAEWPARMQRLHKGPLIDALPKDWELWLDGGHNPGAGEIVATQAEQWSDKPLYMVFGILNTKDPLGFIGPIAPHVKKLCAVTIPDEEASLSGDAARDVARAAGIDAFTAGSVDAAVRALAKLPGPARVLIAGSLYLAGVVLADNG
jgi:dihydrofolate synthase/folylpolyglutamate synthase